MIAATFERIFQASVAPIDWHSPKTGKVVARRQSEGGRAVRLPLGDFYRVSRRLLTEYLGDFYLGRRALFQQVRVPLFQQVRELSCLERERGESEPT